jgi:hypothetical protein
VPRIFAPSGFSNIPFIDELKGRHFAGVENNAFKLWRLMNFIAWHGQVVRPTIRPIRDFLGFVLLIIRLIVYFMPVLLLLSFYLILNMLHQGWKMVLKAFGAFLRIMIPLFDQPDDCLLLDRDDGLSSGTSSLAALPLLSVH